MIARFIPFGRTAVTFTAGYTQGPAVAPLLPLRRRRRRVLWATYATMLGYIGGKQFEEQPWKGLILAFAIAVGLALTVEGIRAWRGRRRATQS